MLKPSNYKHIIWDWNGTLLDDAWLFVDIMNIILQKRNMNTITVEKYREIFGFPIKSYYKQLGFDMQKESFEILGLEFIEEYKTKLLKAKLHPMSKFVLHELSSLNIKHHILSASHQDLLNNHLEYYKVEKFFDHIIGLDNYYANSKINEGFKLIKRIKVDSKYILFIGDTKHDFEVAKTIGVDCLLISHGHHSHSRLLSINNHVIKNMENILN